MHECIPHSLPAIAGQCACPVTWQMNAFATTGDNTAMGPVSELLWTLVSIIATTKLCKWQQ